MDAADSDPSTAAPWRVMSEHMELGRVSDALLVPDVSGCGNAGLLITCGSVGRQKTVLARLAAQLNAFSTDEVDVSVRCVFDKHIITSRRNCSMRNFCT